MKNTRLMLIGILLIAVLVPSFAFATTYNTTLFFQSHQKGESRTYSAGNMRCKVYDAHTPAGTGTVSFTVKCYKDNLLSDKQIGTTKTYYAKPTGYDNSRYFGSGVTSGKYYFVFDEVPNDMIPIISDDVVLKTE